MSKFTLLPGGYFFGVPRMTSKVSQDLARVNVRLWASDLQYLRETYPDNYNAQLRRILASWVEATQEPSNDEDAEREITPTGIS